MGKISESVSGWFSKDNRPVDEDILKKGVVWDAAGHMQSCLFCDFANHSKEHKIIFEDDHVAAFHPRKQSATQHILVIPKRHISTVGDLVPDDVEVLERMKAVAEELLKCDASSTQLSFHIPPWNSVDHLHLHAFETPFLSWWQGLRFSEGKPWCASFERVKIWAAGGDAVSSEVQPAHADKDEKEDLEEAQPTHPYKEEEEEGEEK